MSDYLLSGWRNLISFHYAQRCAPQYHYNKYLIIMILLYLSEHPKEENLHYVDFNDMIS